jgi:hypothetical protein
MSKNTTFFPAKKTRVPTCQRKSFVNIFATNMGDFSHKIQ